MERAEVCSAVLDPDAYLHPFFRLSQSFRCLVMSQVSKSVSLSRGCFGSFGWWYGFWYRGEQGPNRSAVR
jgi:hypothetical protein